MLRGIWSAQGNALLLAVVIFAAAAVIDRRWWVAAGWLALAVHLRLWPVALVMLLCVCHARRLTGPVLACTLGLAAVPFLTRPWDVVLDRYERLFALLARIAPLRWGGYRDAWTIWEQFGPVDRTLYLALQAMGAVAVLAFCVWQRHRLESSRRLLTSTLAIWASWQLLLGPGSERLTYGLIAPFASAAVVLAFAARRRRALAVAAWSMIVVLGSGAAERALLPYVQAAPAIQPAGVALYVVWLLCNERATPAAAGPEAAERAAPG